MPCPINPLECPGAAVGAIAGSVAKAGAEGLADAIREGAKWVIKTTVGWWLNVPSTDLANSPAKDIRNDVIYLALVVAVGGLIWGGVRLAFRRKSEAAWDIGTGIIRLAAVSALAFILPQLLMSAGDSFSSWVLNNSVSDPVANRFIALAAMGGITAPGAVIFAGMVLIFSGIIQAILMFLREGAIVILVGVVILAAAGGFNPATKSWFPKVTGWALGLIFYKPFAALTYAAAFHFIGSDDGDPRTVFVGITMMVLSIVALPTMIKFFSWAAPAAVNGSGAGGALAGLAGAGAAMVAMRGAAGGGSASDQASRIRSDLGPAMGPSGGGPSGAGAGASTGPSLVSVGGGASPSGAGAGSPSAGAASAAAGGGGAAAAAGGPAAVAVMAAKQAASSATSAATGAMTGGADE
jgi:hypothetical protein